MKKKKKKRKKMIELKKRFKKRGTEFEQLWRDEAFAVHQCVTKEGSVYWEVWKVRLHQPDKFHETEYELPPSDEHFETYAKCCTTIPSLKKVISQWNVNFNVDMIAGRSI